MSIRPPASASSVAKGVSKKTQREVHTKTDKYTCSPFRYFIASMDGISSTPVENSVQFVRLRDKYKSNLLDDSRLRG